jgi:7-carboxy-7-deazaguanine synthase
MSAVDRLKITEIFRSLQGESDSVGWPTVFVRLTGCPLRCQYCDTAYAFHGGAWQTQAEVLAAVAAFNTRRVCVTGGEPLAQKAVLPLMRALCDAGHEVSIETSGALDIAPIDPRVRRVMDLKTPDSGEAQRNRWENLAHLRPEDEIKFVICSRADYDWACAEVDQWGLLGLAWVLFSPSAEQLPARQLADWLLADQRDIRFQLQLHKQLWGAEPGR